MKPQLSKADLTNKEIINTSIESEGFNCPLF